MELIVKNFIQLLLSENQKQNLVSRKTVAEEIEKHIEDSLALLRFINIDADQTIVDIGTGAGFPGLILAMHCDSKFTLLEADLKKAAFLQKAADKLGLNNVTILRDRVEAIGHNNDYRNSFSICTSRAVASTRVMLEYGLPLLKSDGIMYLWKGPKYNEEIIEAQDALNILGGQVKDCFAYVLADGSKRYLIKIQKIAVTPEKYPRRIGIPTKRPL